MKIKTISLFLLLSLLITSCSTNSSNETVDLFSEIIDIEDHPQFHDNLSTAKEIWKPYKDNVHVGRYSFNDQTVLTIEGIKDDDIINNIEIYPLNASKNISVNKALSIAYDYINASFIDSAYTTPETYIVKHDQETSYVLQYTLTDIGRELYNNIFISGRIYVRVTEKDAVVEQIIISTSLPRAFGNAQNGYITEDWTTDNPLTKIGTTKQ